MNKEYAISFRRTVQISEDEWEVQTEVLKVNEQNTIKQVIDWYKKIYPHGRVVGITLSEIGLPEPDQEAGQHGEG